MTEDKEIWLQIPIPKLEGSYEASYSGKIRSVDRVVTFKDGRKRFYNGCVLVQRKGVYLTVLLSLNKKEYCYRVHRLVAITHKPNPNNYRVVNHLDCDKYNNHGDNLQWTDDAGNSQHAYQNGRFDVGIKRLSGEEHPRSVLTKEMVIKIRSLYSLGLNRTLIAKQLTINRSTIGNVIANKVWKNIV